MDFAIWLIIAPVAVVALWAAWRAAGSFLFSTYAKPRRMPIAETPADFGLDYRDIEFKSEDGIVLKGWLIHPPDHTEGDRLPAVITTHGYSTNRSDIIERTAAVAAAGFLVLTFDWRNSGESEGEICTGGLYEQNDLRAAIDYLASLPDADPERIAVYGFSMGAVVAILVASSDERVRAVVTDSPYVNMWEEARHVLWNMFIPPHQGSPRARCWCCTASGTGLCPPGIQRRFTRRRTSPSGLKPTPTADTSTMPRPRH